MFIIFTLSYRNLMADHLRPFSDSVIFELKRAQMIKSENNKLTLDLLGLNWKNWCMYYMCMHLILLFPVLWRIVFLYYWIHLNTSLIHTRLHFNASFDKYSRLDEEMIIKTCFFPHPKRNQTHFLVKTSLTFCLLVCYTVNI